MMRIQSLGIDINAERTALKLLAAMEVPCITMMLHDEAELTLPPIQYRCPECTLVFHQPFNCRACCKSSVPFVPEQYDV